MTAKNQLGFKNLIVAGATFVREASTGRTYDADWFPKVFDKLKKEPTYQEVLVIMQKIKLI